MTENKPKEVIERVSQQVGQTWTKVQPQLQTLLLKLVRSLLPALRNLQTKLTASKVTAADGEASATSTGNVSSNPNLDKALQLGKGLSAKAIAT